MNLIETFNALDPARKRQVIIGGVVFGVVGTSLALSATMEKKKSQTPHAQRPEVTVVAPERMTGVEQFASQMQALSKQIDTLTTTTKHLQAENEELRKKTPKGEGSENTDPLALADAPGGNLPVLTAPPSLPPPLPVPPPPPPSTAPTTTGDAPPKPAPEPQKPATMRILGESGAVTEAEVGKLSAVAEKKEAKDHDVYIPAGSMFTAVLLNGLDAPTSSASQKEPIPVVLRVKREAVLPNYAAIDVRECFLVAAGFGQLSAERAMLRSENLSCVRQDGQVFETKLEAYVVGSDGKVGIPGRLVSKQGQMIAQSMIAGIFSGLGGAMNRTKVPALNLSATGGPSLYESERLDSFAQGGIAGGIGTTSSMIARFYMDMAKESFPVVEVHAGAVGTVIVTRGANLPLKGSTSLQRYIDPNAMKERILPKPANQGSQPKPVPDPVSMPNIDATTAKIATQNKQPDFKNGVGW